MDKPAAVRIVWAAWRRNGYLKDREPRRNAKPTLEARISVAPGPELRSLKAALRTLGIAPGHPFAKGRQRRVPIYGRARVEALLRLFGLKPRRWRAYPAATRRRTATA